jgi:Na+/melibiose symporter-like transporter
MRFCHQITAVIFLFATGLLLGRNPAVWKLQLTILCGAFIFAGRALFIARIPAFNTHKAIHNTRKGSFYNVMSNAPLVNFSFYFFILNLASWGAIPLMTIYLKNKLNAPDNIIVMISGLTLTGMLTGYLIAHKLIKLLTVKSTLYLIHISYIIINIIFFCIAKGSLTTYIIITVLLAIYSLMAAVSSIIIASGMLALANQENKRISMAFCGALCYSGSGLSRLLSSLLLGSKIFAFNYYIASLQISHYQTLFLIYALSLLAAILWLRLKIDRETLNQI